ncbi:translation initiation factor eIF-2B beta subunit [Pseudohyphozyma bogoriensis]|nr:translation initiation factor eIF-2B beta subunit [Pseudohyphozyma bogoriensis]
MVSTLSLTDNVSKPLIHRRIEALAARLRRRQLVGSREVALEVVRLFKEVVAGARVVSFEQLTDHIEAVGKVLQDAGPKELVVTNMYRRILKFLHEEYATALTNFLSETTVSAASSSSATPNSIPATPNTHSESSTFRRGSTLGSMFDLLGHKSEGHHSPSPLSTSTLVTPAPSSPASPQNNSPSASTILHRPLLPLRTSSTVSPQVQGMLEEDFSRKSSALKPIFVEAIQELMEEVEMTYRNVGEQSIDHIHSGEFILTIGSSKTVEAFLKAASRKRKFTVIVAETAPSFSGRETALALSESGIATILIPDSNIFSLLPRCSKVLLGPHLITADGSLLSIAGSYPLCLAANRMRVPVVIVGGMFKFSPLHLGEADWGVRDLASPAQVMEEQTEEGVELVNPYYDIVPAELVSLYITNLGGHPSSLLYRLLSDMYGSVRE